MCANLLGNNTNAVQIRTLTYYSAMITLAGCQPVSILTFKFWRYEQLRITISQMQSRLDCFWLSLKRSQVNLGRNMLISIEICPLLICNSSNFAVREMLIRVVSRLLIKNFWITQQFWQTTHKITCKIQYFKITYPKDINKTQLWRLRCLSLRKAIARHLNFNLHVFIRIIFFFNNIHHTC